MPAEVLIRPAGRHRSSTAATLMMKGMTAQYLFRQVYPLQGGETILYHAAAGGVGLIACQWARALGVAMIGTVSTDDKAARAQANGCTHTIVTSRENIVDRVKQITNGRGVPVVFDSVGKDTLEASLNCLQPRGTLVSNGTSSGSVVIDTMTLAAKGSLWLTRPAMMHYIMPRAHMLAMAAEVFDMVLSGEIHQRALANLPAGRGGRRPPRPGVAPNRGCDRVAALNRRSRGGQAACAISAFISV